MPFVSLHLRFGMICQLMCNLVSSDGKPRDTVSSRDSLETAFLLSWSWSRYSLSWSRASSRHFKTVATDNIVMTHSHTVGLTRTSRHPIRHNEFQWSVYLYETLALAHFPHWSADQMMPARTPRRQTMTRSLVDTKNV